MATLYGFVQLSMNGSGCCERNKAIISILRKYSGKGRYCSLALDFINMPIVTREQVIITMFITVILCFLGKPRLFSDNVSTAYH